jgi:2,3-bisphosphoglycerate-independent phosphoglycerate mutase
VISQELIKNLIVKNNNKIILMVLDGVAGIPNKLGKTEIETAYAPNFDLITRDSITGIADPVSMGITPGSGPGHLSIFGYDPIKYMIGRGILAALGIGFPLKQGDIAVRGNFATLDSADKILDRRAGRIPTEHCKKLTEMIQNKIKKIQDTEIFIKPVMDYRFTVIFRGEDLSDRKKSAKIVNEFIEKANSIIKDQHPANGLLLRGFSSYPEIQPMTEIYGLKPAAIATYPMYRGLAKLVGMDILDVGSTDIMDELKTLKENYDKYDFFYFHIKKTDSYGEDGNFDAKVRLIEEIDEKIVPEILKLNPTVLAITCDHSTPAIMKQHSFHGVPFVLLSPYARPDRTEYFSEREIGTKGGLGRFEAKNEIILMLAHALKLKKFGA